MKQAITFKCQLADETVYVNYTELNWLMISDPCQLADETVYVNCTELNWLMISDPNDWVYYTDSDNCQGQCRKKELTFISVCWRDG